MRAQKGFVFVFSLSLTACLISFNSCTMKDSFEETLDGEWLFKVDSFNVGVKEQWYVAGGGRSDWKTVHVPDHWDRYNLSGYDGIGWYAKTFELDSAGDWSIFFSGVDDDADVWLNGLRVGSHEGYSEAFYFDVSKFVRVGKNEVVVRVNDQGGPGGIYRPVALSPLARVEELMRGKFAAMNARASAAWVRDAVIYEVYLRSFSKTGTIKALEERISELKNLGVTVLWLMPIHPVGELNRKGKLGSPYSIQDYYEINSEFGTIDDFRSLVKTVHNHGMKIIIDLVANHTSWDSKLLMEHPERFTKNEEGNIVSPNADWTDVADLNYDSHELRKYMIEMMEYWVKDVAIDGFRCDVAELVPTDFWEVARRELDKIKPVMMLSEGTIPEHHVVAFDLTYSWNLYDALGKVMNGGTSVTIFDDILKYEAYQFPKGSLRMRFDTNHDKNAFDNPSVVRYGRDGAKVATVLTFLYPGVPLIYNGDEVGNGRRLDLFDKVDIDWGKNPEFRRLYTKLSELRRSHVALREGEYVKISNSDGRKVFTFARRFNNDAVVAVLNLSREGREAEFVLPSALGQDFVEFFSSSPLTIRDGIVHLKIKPWEYKVFTTVKTNPMTEKK